MDKNRTGRYYRFSGHLMKSVSIALCLTASLLVQSCDRGLAHSSLRDIEWEKNELRAAHRALEQTGVRVRANIAADPGLFNGVSATGVWDARLRSAQSRLDTAERDDRELTHLARQNRAAEQQRVDRVLAEEQGLRQSAVSEAKAVEAEVEKWRSVAADPASAVASMNARLRSIQSVDLGELSKKVEKAEGDWPAKKSDLERRMSSLTGLQKSAQDTWNDSRLAREQSSPAKVSGPQIATLIATDDALARDEKSLTAGQEQLNGLSEQLYDSWDQILADLEVSHFGRDNVYRERLKIVRAHILDPASHRSEVTSEERWVNVPEPAYHSLENNIGMTIAHKDAGLYDSEAHESPQPPGFAYVAPVEAGSNQYGYWTRSGGQTFWSFLPEYLILRELLRSHEYRPIYLDEYKGFTAARAAGRTYYGGGFNASTAATRAPTYGTHGSFTAKNYANSRYVQSGGFKGSAYASNRNRTGFSGFGASRQSRPPSFSPSPSGAGKRFGSGAAPSSGRRFGRSGGMGRSFGRR